MKNILMALALMFALLSPAVVVGGQVSAADVFNNCGSGSVSGSPDVCQDANSQIGNTDQQGKYTDSNPIIKIIKAAITILSYIIGVAAIIGIVVSGIRFTTAGGDSNAVASARSGLIYSLIGIAIAALAQVLVAFVIDNVK